MSSILDEMKEEVEQKTTEKNKKQFAKRLLKDGKITPKEAVKYFDLPIKTVKEIRASLEK